ncbi:MAG: sensor histidine kinase [Herbinix sp.]|nr:sensor histidine kinase [Herbinix sp.]
MLKSIRNRLILLYTGSTGLILTVVLILVQVLMSQQVERNTFSTFQNNFITVNQTVQLNHGISNLAISELEIKNNLIIHIEDNGVPFLYQGGWKTPTDRSRLIDKVKEAALKDKINTSLRPITKKELQSQVYEIRGDRNDRYLSEVYIMPTQGGFRSLIILQYISDRSSNILKLRFFITILNLAGIALLYFVSCYMVDKSLKPVEESRRLQTEFIAAASHELKSPLAVIRANASAIMLQPDRAEHFTKGIDKECRRLSKLTEDMLLLANADARSWKVKKELLDMDLLLIETLDTFLPLCQENGKQLKLELPKHMLPKAEGDFLRIMQLLAILIDNAINYSVEGDTIVLRAYAKKQKLWIEVEDHGKGIEPGRKKEVFERFYREDKARRDKNHYGLGLSIAKELIELHGGKISIKDTPGGGATFLFYLLT